MDIFIVFGHSVFLAWNSVYFARKQTMNWSQISKWYIYSHTCDKIYNRPNFTDWSQYSTSLRFRTVEWAADLNLMKINSRKCRIFTIQFPFLNDSTQSRRCLFKICYFFIFSEKQWSRIIPWKIQLEHLSPWTVHETKNLQIEEPSRISKRKDHGGNIRCEHDSIENIILIVSFIMSCSMWTNKSIVSIVYQTIDRFFMWTEHWTYKLCQM